MENYFKKRRQVTNEACATLRRVVDRMKDVSESGDVVDRCLETCGGTDTSDNDDYQLLHKNSPVSDIEDLNDSDTINEPFSDSDEFDVLEPGDVLADLMNIGKNDTNLKSMLQYWAVKNNISHAALRALLHILQPIHPELPLDPRTLLCTGKASGIIPTSGGYYYHFGIEKTITRWVTSSQFSGGDVCLQINIDGLPVFKSRHLQLWPILGLVKAKYVITTPFTIRIFLGHRKPHVDFLQTFIDETHRKHVRQTGNVQMYRKVLPTVLIRRLLLITIQDV